MDKNILILCGAAAATASLGAVFALIYLARRRRHRAGRDEREPFNQMSQKENGKSLLALGTGFIVLGAVFLGAVFLINLMENRKTEAWVEIPSVVTGVEKKGLGTKHHPKRSATLVTYLYEWKIYEDIELNYLSSNLNPGAEIMILVNPDAPEEITVNKKTWGNTSLPLALAGAGLLAAGAVMFVRGTLFCCGILTKKELPPEIREKRERIYGKIFCVCLVLFMAGIAVILFWPIGPIMYGVAGLVLLCGKKKGPK